MSKENLINIIINEILEYSPNLNKSDIKPFIEETLDEIKEDIKNLIKT